MGKGGNPNHDPHTGEFSSGPGGGGATFEQRYNEQKFRENRDSFGSRPNATTRSAPGSMVPHNVIGTRHILPPKPTTTAGYEAAKYAAKQGKSDAAIRRIVNYHNKKG